MIDQRKKNKKGTVTTNYTDIEKKSVNKIRNAINADNTTVFCSEFSEELGYIYFCGNVNRNFSKATSGVGFAISNFDRNTIIATDDYHNLSLGACFENIREVEIIWGGWGGGEGVGKLWKT